MGCYTPKQVGVSRGPRLRSLSHKYSIFTGSLLCYVVFISLAYDYWADSLNAVKATALGVAVLLIAGAIARFTNRLLARPLKLLHDGITAVRHGRLEPIQISRTGDEIEFLGESFNAMIRALARSQDEIRQHQESLEERIRQRTEALERASRRALAASQAKSEFLANMSHELRTPMSGVLGMMDIVLDSKLELEQREQLLTAKSCAITLLALLNDILDLSKIEAGKMGLEEIRYDVRSVVTDCVKSLKPKAETKGIALRAVITPEIPNRIAGDPLRLRQILSNLLSNAVKFTDAGAVEVRLEIEHSSGAGKQNLIIRVTDTGAGIAPEKLSTIFDEFTQADGSISRKYGGTGLGLTITRKLVEMHGGRISVDSQLGKGSTFRVSIPCTPLDQGPFPTPKADTVSRSDSSPETPTQPKETILVVEDNPVNQKVISAMLRRHGYRVEIANNGGEVLAALERDPASLVLMDVQMPIVDGLEATRLIRSDSRWKDLPIVAMTAHAMESDRDLCLDQGMDGYLSKPVSRLQLIAVVEKHLQDNARANGRHRLEPVTSGQAP